MIAAYRERNGANGIHSAMNTLCKLFGALSMLSTTPALPTCIIAVRTPDEVVVGADSLGVTRENKTRFLICKIIQHEGTLAAFTGTSNIAAGFDLPSPAREACDRDDVTLAARVDLFRHLAREKAERYLQEVRSADPERYRDHIASGRPICEVIFASIEDGIPAMVLARIAASRGGKVEMGSLRSTERLSEDQREVWPSGEAEVVREFMVRDASWVHGPPLSVVRLLPDEAVRARPDTVGGPLSIVRLSGEAVSWVERGQCVGK